MPRIAVLISGEYRKFDVTRDTMSFLDNPGVDVFVSTWDKTIYTSEKINLSVIEDVTKDRIVSDLRGDVTTLIDSLENFKWKKYNSRMIDRWKAGFSLIENSGTSYDYVLVTRPDLFLHPAMSPLQVDQLDKYKDTMSLAWATSMELGKLPDVLFISSFANMKLLFNSLTNDDWNSHSEQDWHIWWYKFVKNIFPDMQNTDPFGTGTFCRYWAKPGMEFHRIVEIQDDWRDLRLLRECELHGDKYADSAWPSHVLPEAKAKFASGYFDKYK